MQVITLAQVKTYLGITGSTQDAAITAMLPVIDAKVKLVTGKDWNYQFIGQTASGNDLMVIYNIDQCGGKRPADIALIAELSAGTQLEGTGIASGSYIKEVYYHGQNGIDSTGTNTAPFVRLSSPATETNSAQYFYAGISLAYLPIVAKGVQYLMDNTNTTVIDSAWVSRSIGPLSVSRAQTDANLEARFGMPAWFIKGLPRYHK